MHWIKLDSVHDQWVLCARNTFADFQVLNFGNKYFWFDVQRESVSAISSKDIITESWVLYGVCVCDCVCESANGLRMRKQMKYVWHKCVCTLTHMEKWHKFLLLTFFCSACIFALNILFATILWFRLNSIVECVRTLNSIYIVCHSALLYKEQIENNMRTRTILCTTEEEEKKPTISKNNSAHFSIYLQKNFYLWYHFSQSHISRPKMDGTNESNCFWMFTEQFVSKHIKIMLQFFSFD